MNISSQTTFELGALQSEFHNRPVFIWGQTFIALFFFLLAISAIALIFLEPSPADVGKPIPPIVLLLMSAVFFGIGGFVLRSALRLRGARLQIFENGLVYWRNQRRQVFSWNEIEQFWTEVTNISVNLIPARTMQRYVLQKASGEKLILSDDMFKGTERIAGRIAEETFENLWPGTLEKVASGAAVVFGKFTVTREAISRRGDQLAWTEVEQIKVEQGVIKVEKRGTKRAWASVAYGKTPNAHIFLALAERMLNRAKLN